jgi:hypothetical protein
MNKLYDQKHGEAAPMSNTTAAQPQAEQAQVEPDGDEALRVLGIIVQNAEVQPDASMKGATDCYAVPLDDIEAARTLLKGGVK